MNDGYCPPSSRRGFFALGFAVAVALRVAFFVLFFASGGFMHGD